MRKIVLLFLLVLVAAVSFAAASFPATAQRTFLWKVEDTSGDASPFIIKPTTGNVGIGLLAPQNKLDVAGAMAVGLAYAGASAPSNGLVVEGSVGIGTPTPANALDVKGSEAIGAAYAGSPAPPNSLLVEGQVGIGTPTPKNSFDVSGSGVIGSGFAGTAAAPPDGLLVQGRVGINRNSAEAKLTVNRRDSNQSAHIIDGVEDGDKRFRVTSDGRVQLDVLPQYLNPMCYGIAGDPTYEIGQCPPILAFVAVPPTMDVQGNIQWTGTLTAGSVPWQRLTSFPAACPSGQFVTAVGGTLTCARPSGTSGVVLSVKCPFSIPGSVPGTCSSPPSCPSGFSFLQGGDVIQDAGTFPGTGNAIFGGYREALCSSTFFSAAISTKCSWSGQAVSSCAPPSCPPGYIPVFPPALSNAVTAVLGDPLTQYFFVGGYTEQWCVR